MGPLYTPISTSSYCQKQNYSRHNWNSVVNKTPLSARTNRTIGGRAPSEYIAALEGGNHKIAPERVDEFLTNHKISPLLIRNDEFDLFIRDRAKQLLDLIGNAMGKIIGGRDSEEVLKAYGGLLTEFVQSEDALA